MIRMGDGSALEPGRGFALFDFIRGFGAPFSAALHLLHRREFTGRLTLPLAANFCAVSLALSLTWFWARPLLAGLLEGSPLLRDGQSPESLGLWMAIAGLWWLAPAVLESALGPVLEPLVDLTERRIGGEGMRVPRESGVDVLRRRAREAARILAVQLLALPLLWLLVSIPVAGPVLTLVPCSAAAALAWLSIPMIRRGIDLRDRLRIAAANWPFCLGFGAAVQIGWWIPFFDLLLLAPAASAGAAALYFRFDKQPGRS
ncbi:MAG: hypothetical protein Fur0037_08690 [Planctomycetota bacterium]